MKVTLNLQNKKIAANAEEFRAYLGKVQIKKVFIPQNKKMLGYLNTKRSWKELQEEAYHYYKNEVNRLVFVKSENALKNGRFQVLKPCEIYLESPMSLYLSGEILDVTDHVESVKFRVDSSTLEVTRETKFVHPEQDAKTETKKWPDSFPGFVWGPEHMAANEAHLRKAVWEKNLLEKEEIMRSRRFEDKSYYEILALEKTQGIAAVNIDIETKLAKMVSIFKMSVKKHSWKDGLPQEEVVIYETGPEKNALELLPLRLSAEKLGEIDSLIAGSTVFVSVVINRSHNTIVEKKEKGFRTVRGRWFEATSKEWTVRKFKLETYEITGLPIGTSKKKTNFSNEHSKTVYEERFLHFNEGKYILQTKLLLLHDVA